MINTIYGVSDESLLDKKTGVIDDDNEKTEWVEYWLKGELVHRSVHIELKKNVSIEPIAAQI